MKNLLLQKFGFALVLILSNNAFAQTAPTQNQTPEMAQPAQAQPALEQGQPQQPAQAQASTEQEASEQTAQRQLRVFNAETYPSLLFTYWEQVAIEDARNSRGQNRAPTDEELARDLRREQDAQREMPPPEERDIALSGIAYEGYKNWTIWLNGKRVTPDAIPKEAIDLRVFKEYIELKWFDEYTNQIIPIRLRAHQRFNIDNRMFLPG